MGQFDTGAFAHSLLAGLSLGGDQFGQAAHLAQQQQAMQMHAAEVARQQGQEAAAQRAMTSAYDQAFPAPEALLPPQQMAMPAAPGQQAQQQGTLDTARNAMMGGFQDVDSAGQPGPQAGMSVLQGLAAPTDQVQQPMQLPNPDYAQHMARRADFAGAPSHVQEQFMFGQRGYMEQARQDQDWQRVEQSMRQSGHADDIPHAKAVWYAIHAGVPASLSQGVTAGGGSEEAFAALNDPNADPAAKAHAQALLQQSGGLSRGMGATLPGRAKPTTPLPSPEAVAAYRQKYGDDAANLYAETGKFNQQKVTPGMGDAAAMQAKWDALVQQIGGPDKFDPRLLPVVHDKFVAGQKVGDTLWTKALPKDQGGKAKAIALKSEFDFAKDKWKVANSNYRSIAGSTGPSSPAALDAQKQVNEAATHMDEAHNDYKTHLAPAGVDVDLGELIKHEMPDATPEEQAAEYKRRKGLK